MDYYRPWQSKGSSASGGSGAIIEGNKILTNAHVVSDATFVQVKKNNDSKKYTAKVIAIGHDCDLALLKVEDKSFFDDVTPLKIGDLPQLQDTVTVLGYPQGGDKLSITEGVVSRVELTAYSLSARKLLTVQIDAAINPGNSGGPVVQNGKMVGVAMQRLQSGQNIGYMIPAPIIRHFFDDFKDDVYDGFPMIGIDYNSTDNPTLRQFFKITDKEGGILVTKVIPFSSADGFLQENDIILKINNVPIGEDGTFVFRETERLALPHLVAEKQVGENIKLDIVRDGRKKQIIFPLKPFVSLVPHPHHYDRPPYYIYGGLVFTVLTTDLLKSWGNRWFEKAPNNLLHYLVGRGRLNAEKVDRKVVLLRVLPDDVNTGYHNYGPAIVETVNGEKINSFKGFIQKITEISKRDKHIIFDTQDNARIILPTKNIQTITEHILKRNNIPYQYSNDIKEWLNQ